MLVTGSHLAPEFGLTVNEIIEQGFVVDAAVDMLLASSSVAATAKGMGLAGIGAADALARSSRVAIILTANIPASSRRRGPRMALPIPGQRYSGRTPRRGLIL